METVCSVYVYVYSYNMLVKTHRKYNLTVGKTSSANHAEHFDGKSNSAFSIHSYLDSDHQGTVWPDHNCLKVIWLAGS